jgi:hypothetical protein
MVDVALFVKLEAKLGKEEEVARFLRDALSVVQDEPATAAWFAIRLGPSTFGIFDAFPDESGRQAHLSGSLASALTARASELFANPPAMVQADVLAAKLPSQTTDEGVRSARPRKIRSNGSEEQIPLQVGTELRIKNNGEIIVDNPEVELAKYTVAADAVLSYRFDPKADQHILHLLKPVADRQHLRVHHPDD